MGAEKKPEVKTQGEAGRPGLRPCSRPGWEVSREDAWDQRGQEKARIREKVVKPKAKEHKAIGAQGSVPSDQRPGQARRTKNKVHEISASTSHQKL